jgi:hypothetical protein
MTKFLIVSGDGRGGRGARGLNLYWFLAGFHGRRAVQIVSSSDLDASARTCDVLFVGLPTKLRKDALAGIRFRQLVLFDYEDATEVLLNEDQTFLPALTNRYLKVWVEPGWDAAWKFGVLPIRRQVLRLPTYLRYLRLTAMLGRREPERIHDVSFLGAPGGVVVGNQRVRWLSEIARNNNGRFRFFGGLVASDEYRRELAEQKIDTTGVFYEGERMGFHGFFDSMRRSRAVLTPKGNARWSYRHYESIYAGAIPVSCDMRHSRTLIPLPLEGMVHVPDGASVMPAIDEALALERRSPDIREANVQFLERYLHYGDYSRKKPELMDRFMAQLTH